MNVGFVLLLFSSACAVLMEDAELEWKRKTNVTNEEGSSPAFKWLSASVEGATKDKAKKLPEYLPVPIANDHKEDLKPEMGARQIPKWLQKVLQGFPATVSRSEGATQKSDLIEVLCYFDRIYVRIKRTIFNSEDAHMYLALGSCPFNQINEDYYYFLYYLKTDCGFKAEVG